MFYSKLTTELKKQFKTSDIPIPDTRAQCVAVAQRIWEGLHGSDEKKGLHRSGERKGSTDRPGPVTGPKYPRIGSERDRKDRYHRDHRSRDNRNQDQPRNEPTAEKPDKEPICYQCNKPGHYVTSCPDRKEPHRKAKIQSIQQEYDPSPVASTQPSSRSGSEEPQALSEPEDSDDSLN